MVNRKWMVASLASVALVSVIAAGRAFAEGPGEGVDFTGTYYASLPERAEILHLNAGGTAGITLSDQVTSGAGGFTFSDSMGSWRVTGPRHVKARFMNLNFDLTGVAPAYTGFAVVDYELEFAQDKKSFQGSCQGKIYATGQDPFAPGATPLVEFDCAYLDGFPYRKLPTP